MSSVRHSTLMPASSILPALGRGPCEQRDEQGGKAKDERYDGKVGHGSGSFGVCSEKVAGAGLALKAAEKGGDGSACRNSIGKTDPAPEAVPHRLDPDDLLVGTVLADAVSPPAHPSTRLSTTTSGGTQSIATRTMGR